MQLESRHQSLSERLVKKSHSNVEISQANRAFGSGPLIASLEVVMVMMRGTFVSGELQPSVAS